MRESRDAALNWQVYIIPGSPETRGHGTTGSQAKLDAQQLEMVPPLPGEEAMYAQFRWLMDVVGDDPDLKQAMVDEAVQTEEEVIDPFFEWQHNGKPAGNGWNRSVNNAEWGFDYYDRTGTAKSNMFDNHLPRGPGAAGQRVLVADALQRQPLLPPERPRAILPRHHAPGSDHAFGLGDINLQTFFTPSASVETAIGSVSWGVGPTLVFPSATDDQLGTEKWSAGPGAVVFIAKPPFTYGALVNNVWSFAGDDDRADVNQLLLQPFVNLNLRDGWSIGTAPIVTANWEADSGDTWTLPIGGGVGKLLKVGEVPVQTNLRAYYNAVAPEFGADW